MDTEASSSSESVDEITQIEKYKAQYINQDKNLTKKVVQAKEFINKIEYVRRKKKEILSIKKFIFKQTKKLDELKRGISKATEHLKKLQNIEEMYRQISNVTFNYKLVEAASEPSTSAGVPSTSRIVVDLDETQVDVNEIYGVSLNCNHMMIKKSVRTNTIGTNTEDHVITNTIGTNTEDNKVSVGTSTDQYNPLQYLYNQVENCPVCFDLMTGSEVVYSNDCSHGVCRTCTNNLRRPQCPMCRIKRDLLYIINYVHGQYILNLYQIPYINISDSDSSENEDDNDDPNDPTYEDEDEDDTNSNYPSMRYYNELFHIH